MERLEHIGIAVKNLEVSNELFAKLLGRSHYKTEIVESEGVRTSFFDIGGVKIELLEATRPDSAIATFIEKKGEGLHHLAFAVASVDDSIEEKTKEGFVSLAAKGKDGADNKRIVFLHPKTTNSVLIEMCEEKKN
jgi:methylmalonyl-CoA/ethylmalonyl-CoA epimerase